MNDRISAAAAGRFTFPGTSLSVNRMGYGAMQLAGPHAFGAPADPDEARGVLREALTLGVDHIDTSDYYGPHVTNRLIREALFPYPEELTLVTKIGARRDGNGGWVLDRSADFLRKSVEDNLERLSLNRMPIVNLRMSGPGDDIAAPMRVMRRMQEEGLLAHIGISTVGAAQLHDGPRHCTGGLRAEPLQFGPSRRRRHDRRVGRGRHRLCSLFPAGRLCAATNGRAVAGG